MSQGNCHLFEECEEIQAFRDRITARWEEVPSLREWLIGTENRTPEDKAISYIAFEANYYIQRTNWKNEEISIQKFKSHIRSEEYIERQIAIKNSKVEKHEMKWNTIFKKIA